MLEPPSLSTMLKSGVVLFFAAIDYKDKDTKNPTDSILQLPIG